MYARGATIALLGLPDAPQGPASGVLSGPALAAGISRRPG